MTATGTTTTETLISPPPVRRSRGLVTAAGLSAFAAVALIPWLLTTRVNRKRALPAAGLEPVVNPSQAGTESSSSDS